MSDCTVHRGDHIINEMNKYNHKVSEISTWQNMFAYHEDLRYFSNFLPWEDQPCQQIYSEDPVKPWNAPGLVRPGTFPCERTTSCHRISQGLRRLAIVQWGSNHYNPLQPKKMVKDYAHTQPIHKKIECGNYPRTLNRRIDTHI